VDAREKAATVATALNICLTIVKFALYGMTGSLAILAEAWHSFSDIATSALTFAAVRRTVRKEHEGTNGPPSDAGSPATSEAQAEPQASRPFLSAEQTASLIIGVIIFIGGLNLVAKVAWYEAVPISRPLLAGILFLTFALGSYLVHRLEVDVGERTGSSGLIADGMHARADMMASLLTGVSLVVYHLGVNLDRLIAALIAILVLSVALETVVNLLVGYFRGETRYVPRYRSHEILAKGLDLGWLRENGDALARRVGFAGLTPALLGRVRRWGAVVVVVAVVVAYGRTCFFSVGLRQEGIVEHLGRPTRRAVPPGLHLKWPWPIDQVKLIDKTLVLASRIGNTTDPQAFALIWTREHGTEVPFLAGDKNLFYPYLVVHWRVKDAFDVIYRQQNAEGLLDAVTHQVVSELCARREFYDLASTYRKQLAIDVRDRAQSRLDELKAGLEILSVNMSDIHPPVSVADSFEEVVVALFQEKKQMENEAKGYEFQRKADAAGQAAKKKAEAEAYQLEEVRRATGQAKAFVLRSDALVTDRQITLDRLYYDHMLDALRDIPKVLIEPDVGTPDLWMGFKGPAGSPLTQDQADRLKDIQGQLE